MWVVRERLIRSIHSSGRRKKVSGDIIVREHAAGNGVDLFWIAAGVEEVLRLVADDPQLREDASVIEALRAIPVDELCRAGLDLTAVGLKPLPASAVGERGE